MGEHPRTAYLGPAGTHTEDAVRGQRDLSAGEVVPYGTVPDVVVAVESGAVDLGVVPIENSVEGSVNVTLDLLAFETDLLIRREIVTLVDLNLVGPAGLALGDVEEVVSFPHATAQCRRTLGKIVPQAKFAAGNSTAESVQTVAETSGGKRAAVGTRLAAELYGLAVLHEDVSDFPGAETRFVLLGKGVPPRTGDDKTSIVCFQEQDRPGSLLGILQEFAVRGLNLTKLESRPTKEGLGDYCFLIDIEGHLADALIVDALRGLKFRCGGVKFLGSYPQARPVHHWEEAEGEAAWAEAGRWVESLVELVEGDDRA